MKASFTPAAAPAAPARRPSRARVVTYAEARQEGAAELWAEMDKLIEHIDRLPESSESVAAFGSGPLMNFEKWTHDVETFMGGLPQTGPLPRDKMRQIEKMGLARVEITREISLHLGAAPEALRRYNEEYIPQITINANHSGDPEDQVQLSYVSRRKEELISRISLLEATRMTSVTVAQFLCQIIETPDVQSVHSRFAQVIQPGLQSWRRGRAGGVVFPQMREAAPALELDKPIKIRKPLRFKQPA